MTHPPSKPHRRTFMKMLVVAAAAGASPLIGCDDDDDGGASGGAGGAGGEGGIPGGAGGAGGGDNLPSVDDVFPQGIASGDPTPESVILWTRGEIDAFQGAERLNLMYEVATDEGFTDLVSSGEATLDADTDHAFRMKVTGLSAATTYYYRFQVEGVTSPWGRTKTAPAADADTPVRFAFASCQDYNGRYYHAWKALLDADPVDFVVFLGDYIYETSNDPRFQEATDERQTTLVNGLPLDEDGMALAALTLADYRALYKQYRSDPDLKEVHRLYPFVAVWDDHEFADDSWQDHATHFNEAQGDEQNTERRTAASQAWFEYMPADVTRDASASFPDDMRIYRRLRFGQHVDLFLTDLRSYRADHAVAEGPAQPATGKLTPNSAIGARNFLLKEGFDPIEAEAAPSMLGAEQKAWIIDGITGSDASWKIWGTEVQLSQMLVDLSPFEGLPDQYRGVFYFSVDQWDGYRTERAEVLQALAEVEGWFSICGDIHAAYACELKVDFDDPESAIIAAEFTTPGISSQSVQDITQQTLDGDPVLSGLGLAELVPRFDELLTTASPHYRMANSQTNGVTVIDITGADSVQVEYLLVGDPREVNFDGQVERVRYRYDRDKTLTAL
ncbi:MAG: alkaline phosphatase D family protein [Bradymonadia bacterium]